MRRIIAFVFVFAAPLSAQTQQGAGSPVTDMMIRGRNALNDLKYHEADSLARRVLALGTLLSRQQQVDALQLVVAASYPDEAAEQHTDSAISVIRQLVGLGATEGIPRDMSHPALDSLFSFVARAAQPAKVVLGSRIAGSVLYVDGQPQGIIQGLRLVLVPPGKTLQLSIKAENCASWDSTVTTQAADSIRIGFRNPRCSK
ncbi:MAG TPA: hypothetical protein VIF32_04480 [Gemmatimonadaceae bacterium]|jgi:hypothetical protein